MSTPADDRQSSPESQALLAELLKSIDEQRAVALVTVVKATGDYAAALGRHALVWLDQEPLGSLDLGALEARALVDAGQALNQRRPQTVAIDLTEDVSMQTLGVCGGTMEVYVERWPQAG